MPGFAPETSIYGCVLAGGKSERMHGRDKAQISFLGQPLVNHVIERFGGQVDGLMISANRNQAIYQSMGITVAADTLEDYPGPLAGMLAAFQYCPAAWLATVPCDAPYLPLDLVERLWSAVSDCHAPVAVARSDGRMQPVFALLHHSLQPSLGEFLARGERKIMRWIESLDYKAVDFPESDAFININTDDDLKAAAEAHS